VNEPRAPRAASTISPVAPCPGWGRPTRFAVHDPRRLQTSLSGNPAGRSRNDDLSQAAPAAGALVVPEPRYSDSREVLSASQGRPPVPEPPPNRHLELPAAPSRRQSARPDVSSTGIGRAAGGSAAAAQMRSVRWTRVEEEVLFLSGFSRGSTTCPRSSARCGPTRTFVAT
jgi:hypothetical protein